MTGSDDVMDAKTGERGQITAFEPNGYYLIKASSVKAKRDVFSTKKN
jgi:hypothetical protein